MSSPKTSQKTLDFRPWSLGLLVRVPFQLHGDHNIYRYKNSCVGDLVDKLMHFLFFFGLIMLS